MSEVDGATLMARSLKQQGIDHLFGVVGFPVGPIAAAQGELIDHIARLAPFGAANPEPRFVFPGVRVLHAELVGTGHLRCTLADPLDNARLRGIAFRAAGTPLGQFLAETRGIAIHIAGHLRRDNWRGGDAVQLAIDDAAPAPI